jgi:hypothetical protein
MGVLSFNTFTTKKILYSASWPLPTTLVLQSLPTLFLLLFGIGSLTVPNSTTPQEEMYCTFSKISWLFLSILRMLEALHIHNQPHTTGRSSSVTQKRTTDPGSKSILIGQVPEFSLAS